MDLGVCGVSFVELLILHELWAGERLSLERLILNIFGQGVQYQCRLFLLVQALIFGVPVVSSVLCCGLFVCCLVGFGGLFRALLVPITAGFGTLGGKTLSWPYFQAS